MVIKGSNTKFLEYADLEEKEYTIDFAMVKYEGRLNFFQYIMNKPVKLGIEFFQLCNSPSETMSIQKYKM